MSSGVYNLILPQQFSNHGSSLPTPNSKTYKVLDLLLSVGYHSVGQNNCHEADQDVILFPSYFLLFSKLFSIFKVGNFEAILEAYHMFRK